MGGTFNEGVVFTVDPAGNETVLYSFTGGADGAKPSGALLREPDGTLYGATSEGGAFGHGTVFKLDPSGKETVLNTFRSGAGGYAPNGGLIRDAAGNLYGTTRYASAVFKLSPNGGGAIVYPVCCYSFGSLVMDSAGNLYGDTYYGGTGGTIFEVSAAGQTSVLFNFTRLSHDGAFPLGTLALDSAGNLYGTTAGAGDLTACPPSGCGVVFKLGAEGYTVLHRFSYVDGAGPTGNLLLDQAGAIYGTANRGPLGHGVVFKLAVGP